MAVLLIVVVIGFGLAILPQLWVKSVLREHAVERPDLEGTGGEFAEYLVAQMKLPGVKVEETNIGDHYDPETKTVRLSPQHFGGRSLAAIVVAAHEVGHAMQDATGYGPLVARGRMARQAQLVERIGAVVLLAAPVVMLVLRSPHALVFELMAGLLILASTVIMHAVTLPVEFDASFRRALPLLEAGRFVSPEDMPAARRILRAAAFTYVAAAAISLLNVMRWLRVLRI